MVLQDGRVLQTISSRFPRISDAPVATARKPCLRARALASTARARFDDPPFHDVLRRFDAHGRQARGIPRLFGGNRWA